MFVSLASVSRYKTKSPLSGCASAGLETCVAANSAAHPRRRAMRVMMVVMVASQHEIFKLRDLARLVNSKESIGMIGFANWKFVIGA